jgi:hypothetical protein
MITMHSFGMKTVLCELRIKFSVVELDVDFATISYVREQIFPQITNIPLQVIILIPFFTSGIVSFPAFYNVIVYVKDTNILLGLKQHLPQTSCKCCLARPT